MNLNDVFIEGINNNRLSFYKTAKAILQNEDDIEDAIQDALETGYKNLDTLKEPKYFKTWMTRILINKCYDILRKKSKIVPTEDELLDNNSDGKDYTGKVEIEYVLNKLDKDLKEIVILFYFNDFKQEEIAAILNIPKGTVKSRLFRARSEMVALMGTNSKGF